jgi:hypothetical protein
MNTELSITQLLTFFLAWWMGLYLLGRDLKNKKLRYTAFGLMVYGLALAADLLRQAADKPDQATTLAQWGWPLILLPALFWFGTLFYLLPKKRRFEGRIDSIVNILVIVFALIVYFSAVFSQTFTNIDSESFAPGIIYYVYSVFIIGLLITTLIVLLRRRRESGRQQGLILILLATIFFGLGLSMLLLPLELLPRQLIILGMGFDLVLLGIGIAVSDAFSHGEALLPDFLRSLAYSSFIVLLFSGQVALVMIFGTGETFPMLALLLATIITAVVTQTFVDPIQSGLDWLLFSRVPRIRRAREEARIVASAASRSRDVFDPETLSEEQFVNITRRALSQMGNLPKLSANPLTRLAIIEQRLFQNKVDDNTLERSAELKALLTESIERLKPREQGDFGTTDEWRFYNALYYPYVAGLKPYSRRLDHVDLVESEQLALAWFQAQVPERTLYNWQNSAAKLVASDIKEQAQRLESV